MSTELLFEREGRLATLTLNRPPLNILDLKTIQALERRLTELSADEGLQLLRLRSSGEKAFSAGVAVEDHTADRVGTTLAAFHGVIRKLRRMPAITLAVVRGHCLGGGMELAAACDLILAAEESRFGQPEVDLGCYPPVAAALYPGRIGAGRTLELLLTGRAFSSEEAERLGFVTWRVPVAQLEERLGKITEQLLGRSALVSRLIKRAVRAGSAAGFDEALAEAEGLYLEELVKSEDMNEGLAAFMEKRRPTWKHS